MPLMRGRELKLIVESLYSFMMIDAPYAGARIETIPVIERLSEHKDAPYAGARIETDKRKQRI